MVEHEPCAGPAVAHKGGEQEIRRRTRLDHVEGGDAAVAAEAGERQIADAYSRA